MIESLAKIVVCHESTQDFHVFMRRPRQRVGDKAECVG
jgi:hypothetical protein